MIRAIAIRILRQILLVIVGAEAFSRTEITALSRRGHAVGRVSVDVDVDSPVDLASDHHSVSDAFALSLRLTTRIHLQATSAKNWRNRIGQEA
jgi:hypothetical protein